MNTQSFKTSEAGNSWIVVDAKNKTLGRLATKIAFRLVGKHKPEFTPNADLGDYVIVINAEKINVTGQKLFQKKYYSHSGYPGGIKERRLKDLLENNAEEVLKSAVKGMLPKNKLGRKMIKKLKIYNNNEHPHKAQKHSEVEL